ncbi:TetR/AcrR family transcriptional regulator [Agreia sp. VKM Ac-1783]|uniref:TetR/AcrR family transcriptional regulator n=1 Tax=Agreia sp. VKM Ac-1783 TaxID=1938889 RepID=UPI000A2ABFD1|nr:TetR/AcrR family transcriptional regulator [Agreia sp. VKM Ac-1783]SMQ71302.1 transcriptional regulator, TetR family [Agreia sp. VKM Ac-1783]
MGRTRAFAEIDVVRAARGVFWNRGYEETSLPDLEAATGLNRSSIYHSFGSKRGLFDAAVESYLDDVVRPRLEPLRADEVDPGALEFYLRGLRHAMVDEDTALAKNGCLLLNATGSSLGHEAGLAAVVTAYTTDLRDAVASGVAARRADLTPEGRELVTTTCTGLVFAAMAIVRVDRQAAAALLDAALAAVFGPTR